MRRENEATTPAGEPIRSFLVAQVERFVAQASKIHGVRRIALIGSLTTEKPNPKDADMLVSIVEDADLESLATAGRRLKGTAQCACTGADVFLAGTNGNYLGRICQWRDCRPGVRMRCPALHCGRRQYVCDDFNAVELPAAGIEAPQLELWPEVVRTSYVPADMEKLIAPFERPAHNEDQGHGRRK